VCDRHLYNHLYHHHLYHLHHHLYHRLSLSLSADTEANGGATSASDSGMLLLSTYTVHPSSAIFVSIPLSSSSAIYLFHYHHHRHHLAASVRGSKLKHRKSNRIRGRRSVKPGGGNIDMKPGGGSSDMKLDWTGPWDQELDNK